MEKFEDTKLRSHKSKKGYNAMLKDTTQKTKD
jgi:hypothetical protein